MKNLFLILSVLLAAGAVQAQPAETYVAGQRQPTHITLLPIYQQFDDGNLQLSEFSVPLTAFFPVRRDLGVSLRVGQASARADNLESISGLTDVQLTATYARPVGTGSVVLGLGVNLPSGTQELTAQEFETLALVSLNVFGFQVPSFGRGPGLAPSVTWAQPVSETFVVGLGVAYQLRGAFDPRDDLTGSYDPGDELLLTGGFDARLAPGTSLSGDVTYTRYTTDTVGDAEVFETGDKIVVTAQLRRAMGFHTLWVLGRLRTRSAGDVLVTGQPVEAEKFNPDVTEVRGQYRHRVSPRLFVAVHAQARFFEALPTLPQTNVFGAGLAPEFVLSRQVRLPVRATYYFGDLTGFEVGGGLALRL